MKRPYKICYALVLLGMAYSLLYDLQFHQGIKLDFSSFYSTGLALSEGENPYKNLMAAYLGHAQKLPANLNPPIFLMLMRPFSHVPYDLAVMLWAGVCLMFNGAGAFLAARLSLGKSALKRHIWAICLLYFALFSTFMNTAIAQMGGVLLFFTMAGYFFYLRKHDTLAGFFWGTIAAIKCFPGLLVVFAFKQQRKATVWAMLITVTFLWSLPYLCYGHAVYQHYFDMLHAVLWYGDSWNGSLYGFLFRLFIDAKEPFQSLFWIQTVYFLLSIGCVLGYWHALSASSAREATHHGFALTLVMMLFLSPFGWIYYYSILLFVFVFTATRVFHHINSHLTLCMLWLASFICINLPLDYVMATHMQGMIRPMTLFSIYFYGLIALFFVLQKSQHLPSNALRSWENMKQHRVANVIALSTVFGLSVPLCFFAGKALGA